MTVRAPEKCAGVKMHEPDEEIGAGAYSPASRTQTMVARLILPSTTAC